MTSSLDGLKLLKKELKGASQPSVILDILNRLDKVEVNVTILKETAIGKAVGKLRKHTDEQVQQRSNNLVAKWKEVLNLNKGGGTPVTSIVTEEDDKKKEAKVKQEDAKKRKQENLEGEQAKKTKKEEGSKRASPTSRDSTREKIVELLLQALGEKRDDDKFEPLNVAREIEDELFALFGAVDKDYKAKFRSLSFNIKNPKNPELRSSLMGGVITPYQLCKMSAQDMASSELKKERERIAQWHLEATMATAMKQTSTDMFKCGKCGKRETTYYQMQTRSADEPMTTFHTCTNCGNRWKS